MIDEHEMRMKGKLNFFLSEKVVVHIKRRDGFFWNGLLLEKKSEDVYLIEENKLGKMNLFVSDVLEVDEFREVKV